MGEDKKKKKGLGGLSAEKKKQLKKLIMQKAADDLKQEALAKAKEREDYIKQHVDELKLDGVDKNGLAKLCKSFHSKVANAEDEKYDLEMKLRKQDLEINDLNMKVNDTKGKFSRPVLKKVSRTDAKFAKLAKKKKPSISSLGYELKHAEEDHKPLERTKSTEEEPAEEPEDEEEEEEEEEE